VVTEQLSHWQIRAIGVAEHGVRVSRLQGVQPDESALHCHWAPREECKVARACLLRAFAGRGLKNNETTHTSFFFFFFIIIIIIIFFFFFFFSSS
jgi:hypothetical protein